MITKLLQVEPKERMTVAQAVNHQWFTGISIFQATGFSNSNPLSHAGMGPPKYSPSKG
jgi:serine/threonine protein kinase